MGEIKVGDTVKLKSGGPVMTVAEIGRTASGERLTAWCDWFEKGKKETGAFPVASLVIAEM